MNDQFLNRGNLITGQNVLTFGNKDQSVKIFFGEFHLTSSAVLKNQYFRRLSEKLTCIIFSTIELSKIIFSFFFFGYFVMGYLTTAAIYCYD